MPEDLACRHLLAACCGARELQHACWLPDSKKQYTGSGSALFYSWNRSCEMNSTDRDTIGEKKCLNEEKKRSEDLIAVISTGRNNCLFVLNIYVAENMGMGKGVSFAIISIYIYLYIYQCYL